MNRSQGPGSGPSAASKAAPWVHRPQLMDGEVPVLLRDLLDDIAGGSRILDLGSGPGSFDYARHPDCRILATDILPLTPPAPRAAHVDWFRADAALLPMADDSIDVVIAHYVFEHVTDLDGTLDETARVVRPGGLVYCSVPRSAAFDDRFYRFAGYVAKYLLGKFKKRIEHQQRFTFESLNRVLYQRGFALEAFSVVPAGYSWMNDPRTKRLQGGFVATLGWIKRLFGIDLFEDANFICRFRHVGRPGYRHVSHVCRGCGEHAVIDTPQPPPASWRCPWCGLGNGLFLTPGERRRYARRARERLTGAHD